MDFSIVDGTGKGYALKIDSDNRARVRSTVVPIDQHVNMLDGQSYACVVSVTPAGAGNCFFYLKNTSEQEMHVNNLRLHATGAAEGIQIKLKDSGTAAGGSTVTPVNKNTAVNYTATCTCEYGTNITGLSGGSIVDILYVAADAETAKFDWMSDLLVARNDLISCYAITGSIPLVMTMNIYFHNHTAEGG